MLLENWLSCFGLLPMTARSRWSLIIKLNYWILNQLPATSDHIKSKQHSLPLRCWSIMYFSCYLWIRMHSLNNLENAYCCHSKMLKAKFIWRFKRTKDGTNWPCLGEARRSSIFWLFQVVVAWITVEFHLLELLNTFWMLRKRIQISQT